MQNHLVVSGVAVAVVIGASVLAPPSSATTARPAVTGLNQTAGPSSGGTRIVVTGHAFTAKSTVRFGAARGRSVTVLSAGRLKVTSPKHAAGVVDVRVTSSRGTSSTQRADRFTFVGRPTISKLSVHSSLPTGGQRVTIGGTNFTDVRSVLFGATKGTHVRTISSRSLQVVAPAHRAGAVTVRVLARGGESSAAEAAHFTYAAPTTITDVPASSKPDEVDVADVDCPSKGNCYAVGFFEPSGRPLVESSAAGSGGSWKQTTLPLPSGSQAGQLQSVSCPSASQCFAVGSYLTAGGTERPLLEQLISGHWLNVSPTLPAGSTSGYLDSIECPTSTMCAMVGTAKGAGEFLTTIDDQGQFTSVVAPAPAGYTAQQLDETALDCASAKSCVVVSSVLDQAANEHATSDVFTGSGWVSSDVPVPDPAANSTLDSVSCLSSGTCVAVGNYDSPTGDGSDTYTFTPMISTLSGSTWTSTAAPSPAGAAYDAGAVNSLRAVSCVGTYCEAVGGISRQGSGSALVERSTGGKKWVATAQSAPSGTDPYLGDVACASATFCVALGSTSLGDGSAAFAVVNRPGGLTNQLVPLPAGASGSVSVRAPSCAPGTTFCGAIGLTSGGTDTLVTVS